MYLISLYFDNNSNKTLMSYINKLENITHNNFMSDNHVPAHLTLLALHTDNEDKVIEICNDIINDYNSFSIDFVSIGMFKSVLYVSPVLSRDLHNLQYKLYNEFIKHNIVLDQRYIPYNYLPHITMSKTLNEDAAVEGIGRLYKMFSPFRGNVVSIGVSKTNPYKDIVKYTLKEEK